MSNKKSKNNTYNPHRLKSMLVNLQLQTENLTKKDLRTWRTAWQWAIDIHYPNRTLLYDI